ncbi:hypothetical protein LLEC1_03519 [Akanthomyces lecanii]|uniref:Uncharacterized protein n=1 Tax=Cordyceps confragosa TaxID=2714763 RepID=A0A179I796_CORDF|nr:hypothetical protein LLEC1_03519 [Akanthomyces lecanii]
MSLFELPHPASLPAASIPDDHTATELPSTYNPSSACSSPRPRSLTLSIEQTTSTTSNSPVIDQLPDDMLSIHSTKSESFVSASAPALPAKSALRASRLLATMPQKPPQDRPVLTHAAPHLVYLSSEEDGSSSADDLSDLESFDSDSEESLDGCVAHGEFARAVSVIFSGKPSMINLTGRSASLASFRSPSDDGTLRGTLTEPVLGRIRSASLDKRRPKFLHVDPFAASKADKDDNDSLRASKTPTAMFSRAFSNLVKKRSRPVLSPATRDNELVHMEQVGEEALEELHEEKESPKSTSAGPVKYQDIMAAAKKNVQPSAPAPATPTSPNSTRNGLRSFSLGRRMSVRA